jgi:hypothetical protein
MKREKKELSARTEIRDAKISFYLAIDFGEDGFERRQNLFDCAT